MNRLHRWPPAALSLLIRGAAAGSSQTGRQTTLQPSSLPVCGQCATTVDYSGGGCDYVPTAAAHR